jgi:transcriptional regulator GlxA family with amidase domain
MRVTSEPAVKADKSSPGKDIVGRLDRTPAAANKNSHSKKQDAGVELSIGFMLWPRFPMLSLAGFCDALRHAADVGDQSRPLRCSWQIIGIEQQEVHASCGIPVKVQAPLTAPGQFDYIVVIGGLLSHMDDVDPRYWHYLQQAAELGVPLIGMCTGSFILARAGLLDDRVACVHAFHFDDYRNMFPALRVITHSDYLIDGNRITCAGGVSVIELASQLINLHCGPDRAAKVIYQMTVSRSGGAPFVERRKALGYLAVDDVTLRHCIMLMEENLEAPLGIATLAELTGVSVRQLGRRFQDELGIAPQEFYRLMRLRYARWQLLTTGKAITAIAYECGFADASHFIRGFKQVYGVPPAKLRSAVNPVPLE